MKANNNLTKVTSHYKSWVRSWTIVNNYGIISKVIQISDKWQLFCCFKDDTPIVKITLTWIWIVNFELYLRPFIWKKYVSLLDLGYIYSESANTVVCIIVRRLACFWSKMPMFQWAGMREGVEPLPLAFQYLILMI